MALIIVLVVAAVVLVWGISTYNGFVRGDVNVEEAFATMDVYLKKRFDLIPNLVETVKGYAAHEAETLKCGNHPEREVRVRSGPVPGTSFHQHRGGAVPGFEGQSEFPGADDSAAGGGRRYRQCAEVLQRLRKEVQCTTEVFPEQHYRLHVPF